MTLKRSLLSGAAIAAASTLIFAGSPALATPTTIDAFTDIGFNGIYTQTNSDWLSFGHHYGWDADNQTSFGDSTTHASGSLVFLDDSSNEWAVTCDEQSATAVIEDDGDAVTRCETVSPNAPYNDLLVTPELRYYHLDAPGVVLARALYAIENPTNADITVSQMYTEVAWDEQDNSWPMHTSQGFGVEGDSLEGADVRWVNTATFVDPETIATDYASFGAAWRGVDNTTFTDYLNSADQIGDDDINPLAHDVVIPAGQTVYLAFYSVYGSPGPNADQDAMSALMFQTDMVMALFDAPFDTESPLTKGLEPGANVLNWSTVADASAPSPSPSAAPAALASTGADLAGAVLALGLALLGAVFVVLRRRTI